MSDAGDIAMSKEERRPVRPIPWTVPLLLAILCLAAAALAGVPVLRVALVAAGTAFFVLAGLGVAARQVPRAVRDMLARDSVPSLVCDGELRVLHANPAADATFRVLPHATLRDILRAEVAHPAALLRRLADGLAAEGAMREEVIVGDGALRVEALRAGRGRSLWRLERFDPPASDATADLPLLTLGRGGVVLAMNGAARQALGRRPRHVEEILGAARPVSGALCEIAGATGRRTVRLQLRDTGPGQQELALLPAETSPDLPEAALAAMPIAVLRVAQDGCILSANAEARDLLGLGAEETRKLGALMEGLGRPIADWLADAAAGRGLGRPEFLRLTRGDSESYVQVTLTRAPGPGDAEQLLAVLSDATELKTLEAQFVQSQKMQAIGQLAGGIAHDFNNLLTAISGHCDLLLLRHSRGDGDYADLIQIAQNANRAAALVGQLLAFSRKQTMKTEILDLRDTLSDLTHLLNRLVGEKVTLELRHAPALPAIRGDRRQLEQVMMNLVVNARDAMPEGGRILIETERFELDAPLRRDRAVVEPGAYVLVKVSDTGSGIPPEQAQKVFEPFFTTKRTGEGTGLGLSTVYGIVKQTGGYVFLDSRPGEGSCFRLIFPAQDRAKIPKPEDAGVPGPAAEIVDPTRTGVVLLVEDEAPVRAFATRALGLRGFTVIEAESGEAALDILADEALHVDIFVSDVVMQGLDGPSWVREARAKRPDVPVIFVSGYAEDALGGSAAEVENADFLQKPFSLNDLAKRVQARLG